MTEAQVRNKAIQVLTDRNFYYWYPARTKFKTQIDVFGVFDMIAFRGSLIRFIQITTSPNLASRRKKVQAFIKRSGFGGYSEVWAYNKKKRIFKIERVK